LAKDPSERFASCGDFVAALGGAKVASPRRGKRWLWPAALLLLALIAVGAAPYRAYTSYRARRAEPGHSQQEEPWLSFLQNFQYFIPN
jgi:hypothetical protein